MSIAERHEFMHDVDDETISGHPELIKALVQEVAAGPQLRASGSFRRYQSWLNSHGDGLGGYSYQGVVSLSVHQAWFQDPKRRERLSGLLEKLMRAQGRDHIEVAIVNSEKESHFTLRYSSKEKVKLFSRTSKKSRFEGAIEALELSKLS